MENQIDGFKWYLPHGFKDCLVQCKFEQGDLIFPHKLKGKTWGEDVKDIDYLIQVKSPIKSHTNSSEDFNVFYSNWSSKIIFEKIYPNDNGLNKTIETTQGRFYTFLWKGEEDILNESVEVLPVFIPNTSKYINSKFIKLNIPKNWCGFAIIYDSISDLIISKRTAIKEILEKNFEVDIKSFNSKDAVISDFDKNMFCAISPTVSVELFLINTTNNNEVDELIKTLLFKGLKDYWKITRHGILIQN
jgi:hypothetical protein